MKIQKKKNWGGVRGRVGGREGSGWGGGGGWVGQGGCDRRIEVFWENSQKKNQGGGVGLGGSGWGGGGSQDGGE